MTMIRLQPPPLVDSPCGIGELIAIAFDHAILREPQTGHVKMLPIESIKELDGTPKEEPKKCPGHQVVSRCLHCGLTVEAIEKAGEEFVYADK